ncbi:hypothetical protein F7725_026806 [Dissostichus mawsoni]|uniref:Uncharacterized protein n=1 Tax=Dissostichus mawsoni TaxID=36200 RepID=A0A7J5X878_DISMA|nr:hypothetical protein F7725_026806 [Dissostichus mawsoni]
MTDGGWLLLQNCHLGLDFLPELLETVTTATADSVHKGFRVWLTTDVHESVPITFLQSSIKFTNEPPLGMKAGLKRTFSAVTQDQLEISSLPQWKPLLYAVAFLHTTVQERRKFGPLGWNIPYEFNQADFTSSMQFVQNHLDDLDSKRGVDWSCLRYMLGEVQYGGRVTDDLDKRLLNTFTGVWFSESTFSDTFCFYKGYSIPSRARTVQDVLQHIDTLPLVDSPEVFGLHPNADITYQTNLANETLRTIISIQPKDSGGGAGETREASVQRLAAEMLEKLPPDYVQHEVKGQLKKMGPLQPMNIFLRQEVERMQRVIGLVRSTLTDLKLAIDGTIIMSEDLRDALDCMFDARVPRLWLRPSWPSASLGFWFSELLERSLQLRGWISSGRPDTFWLTGFFNPQGFLTAMRQETTRSNLTRGWALDTVTLSNNVTKMMKEDVVARPQKKWAGSTSTASSWMGQGGIGEEPNSARPPQSPLPVVHVFAISSANMADSKLPPGGGGGAVSLYSCPVYKKPRRTDLNFIFFLQLRSLQPPQHWTLRGAALLCDCNRSEARGQNIFSRAKLVEVIKHWEFKYELLDKYAKDLAVKNKHWEIEQREAVIKGLTQSNQLLVQNNAGFVRAENGWQELINQKDSEIMSLKQEKESLSHSPSVSTNWQEKYNALKEESSKRLEEKKATNVESVEKDNKSLAERIRKDTAEKREGWASLSKLIKEKFQKIEDKKSHLQEMSTKVLAVKQEILEEEVKVENNLEEKLPQGPAEEQQNGETVMLTEVQNGGSN